MIGEKTRSAFVALTLVSLAALPGEASACSWCHRWFGGGTTTYYAPYTAAYAPYVASYAPACSSGCGQVVNYMPQTCYRTVYMNAPVVAYRPVSACNPCTGCSTTVMRPVTTYALQPRLVPYTTYSPVVTAAYAPACSSCATAAPVVTSSYYAPAAAAPLAAPAAPSCCGASYSPSTNVNYTPIAAPGTTIRSLAPPATYAAPTTQPSASPYLSQPTAAPSATPPAGTSPPPANTAPQQNKTFESERPAAEPQSRLEPSNSNTSGKPQLLERNPEDRMTALPIRQPLIVQPASIAVPAAADKPANSGWRAARN